MPRPRGMLQQQPSLQDGPGLTAAPVLGTRRRSTGSLGLGPAGGAAASRRGYGHGGTERSSLAVAGGGATAAPPSERERSGSGVSERSARSGGEGRLRRLANGCRRLLPIGRRSRREAQEAIPQPQPPGGGRPSSDERIAATLGQDSRALALAKNGGARVEQRRSTGGSGWTPLLRAASRGDLTMLTALLKAGADPNQCNALGQGALELCVLGDHIPSLKPLIAAGADATANDFAAVRRALEKRNALALRLFGSEVVFRLYEHDQEQLVELRRQAAEESDAREQARLSTLSAIDCATCDGEIDGGLCVVCFVEQRSVLFQPCRHVVLCSTCAGSCRTCPICRRDVKTRTEVFLS
eukprot:TRINITY_DN16829_c0_g1_i2.p1 TRINITY_DN16829_c0_g1~~TRINITY_DN16829_c0_g1_i2.p1  ORF type:complete len:354 (-),score=60.44 TRINITY_DN16829_c0_g1_i2:73-1134(-)